MVYLVGAGPGDPGLITVRGRALLSTCDAVVYDALADPALLVGLRAERHDVGKRGGSPDAARQDEINTLLVRLATQGKRVVRLKGGDPFVFGRGSEEAQALAAAMVPFEVVPGVTAGVAAPAYAGIPVTHRGVSASVTFVTGHEDANKVAPTVDWAALARVRGTLVLYMGVRTLPRIVEELRNHGLAADTPAAAVQWGTRADQRTVVATLATLEDAVTEAGLKAPVIFVIGEVVSLREEIAWLDPGRVRGAIAHLEAYDWIAFTSQKGVELFWDVLRGSGLDARALAALRVIAVGPATAGALLDRGIAADLTPERFVAEGLLEALAQRADVPGTRVLYVAAEGAREVLPNGLNTLGARVDIVPLYRSVADPASNEAMRGFVRGRDERSLVTFTSASAVHALLAAVGKEACAGVPAATIGPATSVAAREAGFDVCVQASRSTIPNLVEEIVGYSTARLSEALG